MTAAETLADAILLVASGPAAQILASTLEQAGYATNVASDEEEALRALEAEDFDLVLVHLQGPDPVRLDVIKLLRMSDPGADGPPVIVLADAMTAEVEQACTDAGVDLRLVSPVAPRTLLDYVGDLLARARSV